MPRTRTTLAAVALGLAVAPFAGTAAAAPPPVTDPLVECAKQYLITSEPPPHRPVTVTSDGKVVVDAGPTVDRTVDWTQDTVRFARCAAGS